MDQHCPACNGDLTGEPDSCPHCGITLFTETGGPTVDEGNKVPAEASGPDGAAAGDVPEARAAAKARKMPDFKDLQEIYQGETTDVIALRTALEMGGISVFTRDEFTKTIDPFITGAYCLNLSLFAPADQAHRARAMIEEIREKRIAARLAKVGEQDTDDGQEELSELDLIALGRRTCWGALLLFTAPFGFYYGMKYLKLTADLKKRPAGYALYSAMTWVCMVESMVLVVILFMQLKEILIVTLRR